MNVASLVEASVELWLMAKEQEAEKETAKKTRHSRKDQHTRCHDRNEGGESCSKREPVVTVVFDTERPLMIANVRKVEFVDGLRRSTLSLRRLSPL
jgi:hypothetical protein